MTALTAADEQLLTNNLCEPGGCFLSSFPASAQAFLIWHLWQQHPRTWICVTDGAHSLERMADDLRTFAFDREANLRIFPAWESLPTGDSRPHTEITGDRPEIASAP